MYPVGLPEALFPPGVATAVAGPEDAEAALYPEEAAGLKRAVPKRIREFTQGRSAARRALRELGVEAVAIPAGPGRAPRWPEGCVGSISHTEGRCIVAVARQAHYRAFGVDIERRRLLEPSLVEVITTGTERERHSTIGGEFPWALATFSAKEAFHKAFYPVTGMTLGFREVEVRFVDGRFSIHAAESRESLDAGLLTRFEGRIAHDLNWVYATAWLPVPATIDSNPRPA